MTVTSVQAVLRLAPGGGPLAGRSVEMAALRRAWVDASRSHRRVVFLAGGAGVGKTRLAAELASEVEAAAAVLVGACPGPGAEPFHVLVEALGPLPTGAADREAMLDALVASVVARAARTPTLLVLDDLHLADRSSLLGVRRIVEGTASARLLVVGVYRDGSLDRSHPLTDLLGALVPAPGVERVAVTGLPPEVVAEMVGDADLGRRLWRLSAGNPVVVAELLRPGAIEGRDRTFDELVHRREIGLHLPARSLLHAAAVAGSAFDVGVAAEAGRVPDDRVSGALKELAAAGFVVDERAGGADRARFVHHMVRDAVERRLEPGVRVRLHLNLARALEARHRGPAAATAWHFRAAAPVGSSIRSTRHSASAGDRAMALLAWDEAALHYGEALATATGAPTSLRADLLLSVGEAQRLAGETTRARQAFLEAAALARSCADGARMAQAALALGQVAAAWGADAELAAVATEARELLGRPAPPAPFADFASDSLYDVLDGVEPVVHPQAPAAAPHGVRDARTAADAAMFRARHTALAGPEHAGERFAAAEGMVALATDAGEPELELTGRGWRVVDALVVGRVEDAIADQAAHADLARRHGGPRHRADAAAWSATFAMIEGRPDDARRASAEAFRFGGEAGDSSAAEGHLLQRWWLALEWGSTQDLGGVIEECRRAASAATGSRTWRTALALALARGGQLDLAAEELRRVTDHGLGDLVRDPGRLHALAGLAEVAWLVGDGTRAEAVRPLLEPFVEQLVVAGRGLACQGSAARSCGLAAAAAHRWDEAERWFGAALTVHRSVGALPLLARTRFEWSKVLADRGRLVDRRRAADSRRKADELATRLGMARLRDEIAGRAT